MYESVCVSGEMELGVSRGGLAFGFVGDDCMYLWAVSCAWCLTVVF